MKPLGWSWLPRLLNSNRPTFGDTAVYDDPISNHLDMCALVMGYNACTCGPLREHLAARLPDFELNECGCKRMLNERGEYELMYLHRCALYPHCGVPYVGERS